MASKYWLDRLEARQAFYDRAADSVMAKINNAYISSMRQLNSDISDILRNYAEMYRISPYEARKYLDQPHTKTYLNTLRRRAARISDDKARDYMQMELDAPAYRARITRLQAVQESMRVGMTQVADVELQLVEKHLKETAKEAYYRTMFDIQQGVKVGFSVTGIPTKRLEQIMRNNWSGTNYSKRIWQNRDALAEKLQQALTEALSTGKTTRQTFDELSEISNLGRFAANRLLRTETSYITNQVEMEAYTDAGIAKYEFVSVLDRRTSEICQEKDGKTYNVSEREVGVNCPPMHPWCRSVTAPVISGVTKEGMTRRARDPDTGEQQTIPADMTYGQWKKTWAT
jgi:SPP1 gp7 family putative phage head morphogenesis protein